MRILSLFVPIFLFVGFLVLTVPESGNTSVLHGCCIVDSECVGCESGCSTSESYCMDAGGGSPDDGVCINDGGGATCDDTTDWENQDGCCVLARSVCTENVGWRNCLGDSEPILDGELWFPGASCSEVPQCAGPTDVPSLSEWGLIALAGILGIIGFIMVIRRKNVTA